MLGEANSFQTDHWFQVGVRCADKVWAAGSKNSAEQEANIKRLMNRPRMQFIAGFKLRMVELG